MGKARFAAMPRQIERSRNYLYGVIDQPYRATAAASGFVILRCTNAASAIAA
jgi:hypothetical protein